MTARSVRGENALPSLAELRRRGAPIVMITAYDYPAGRIAEQAGADVVLVGDSAAMTVLGYSSTREVSVDELLVLTRAVRRAVRGIPIVGDLPFGSYEESDELAVASARRFVDEAGCDAVKLEGAGEMVSRVRAIIEAGMAVVVEAVPSEIGTLIAERLTIPVIGIGAGSATDGQVLVYHDLLGYGEGRAAKFVRRYANAHDEFVSAVRKWAADVRGGLFPSVEEGYRIDSAVVDEVKKRL